MSRGYIEGEGDETNPVHLIMHTWVQRAIKGKRGQRLLHDLADALDAMPEKRLVRHSFACESGVCPMGALGRARGVDMSYLEEVAERIWAPWKWRFKAGRFDLEVRKRSQLVKRPFEWWVWRGGHEVASGSAEDLERAQADAEAALPSQEST